jgi:hypothetical protein
VLAIVSIFKYTWRMSENKRVIPAEAVEAAFKDESANPKRAISPSEIYAILEAAAPHLLATVSTAEELDALPHGSVIRSSHRHYWVAHKEDGEGGNQGWAAAGTSRTPTDLASLAG